MQKELQPGVPLRTHFQVGTDVQAGNISELRFRIHFWDLTDRDDVTVMLNDHTLRDLMAGGPAQTFTRGQWLECQLHQDQVESGENRVELLLKQRDESTHTPLTLDAVQLHVHHNG